MTSVNNSTVNKLCNDIAKNTVDNGVTYSRAQLEGLFENTNYFNAGEEGAKKIQQQIDNLEATIKTLKKEAEDLQKQIDKKNLKVDNKADKLSEIASQINKDTVEYQQNAKAAAQQAAVTAIQQYKNDPEAHTFEDYFAQSFFKNLTGGPTVQSISNLYSQYETIKGSISPVANEIQRLLNETKGLQTKLDNTSATINMLEMTKNNMSETIKGAYKNVDTNSDIPVFSGAKAEVANNILKNFTVKGAAPKDGAAEPAQRTAEQQKAIDNKMNDYKKTNTNKYPGGCWFATYDKNPEVRNLVDLVNGGMIEELQGLGASSDEILTFISSNWNVGILRNETNGKVTYTIPQKGDKGGAMFDKLNGLVAQSTTVDETASNVDKNTLKGLQDNSIKILDDMYKAGFTFKEAMYVFTQVYPNSGITYDIKNQAQRNYQILADSKDSNGIYGKIKDTILDHWNVGGTVKTTETPSGITSKRGNNDPITFQSGDTTYTFINDRNGDGEFNYNNGQDNDLMGSKDGLAELLAFDYNNDGIIDAKDVDKDGNKALDQITLMSNKQTESVANKTDVDGYKGGANYKGKGAYTNSVDFGVTYTSASELGITEINLKAQKESGKIHGEDTVKEGYNNVNGSNVINQFTIKTDGSKVAKNITANETLNTDENLEIFYGQVAKQAKGGKNSNKIYSSLTKAQVNSAFDNMTNADAIAAKAILDDVEAKLKDAQEYSGKPQDVTLNMEREDFQKLYGTDGTDGTYVKQVIKNGAEAAELYKTEKGDEVSENQDKAHDATGKAVDDYNESIKAGTGKKKVDTSDPYVDKR